MVNQSETSETKLRGNHCVQVFFGASALGAWGNVVSGLVVSDMIWLEFEAIDIVALTLLVVFINFEETKSSN
jgi:hypothetical protein